MWPNPQCFFLSGISITNIHDSQDSREGGTISLSPLYHFHPLHRQLNNSGVITAGSSPLDIENREPLVFDLFKKCVIQVDTSAEQVDNSWHEFMLADMRFYSI